MKELLQTITTHYLLFTFLTSLGLLQLAGVRSRTPYLLLFQGRRTSAVTGVVLLATGYLFFFTQADYDLPGLEGAQLFFEFAGSAFLALLVCAGANVARSGQVGTARRALRRRISASLVELRPLFALPRRFGTEEEVT